MKFVSSGTRIRLRTLRRTAKWSGLAALLSVNVTVVMLLLVAGRGCAARISDTQVPVVVSKTPSQDGRLFCVIESRERPGTGSIEFQFSLEDQNGPLEGAPLRYTEDDSNGTMWLATWRNRTVSIFTGNSGLGVFRFAGTAGDPPTGTSTNRMGQFWSTNPPPITP